MKNKNGIDFIVGLFVLAALGSFVWMAINVTAYETGTSDKTIHISATFDNIGSLKPKSPVVVSGVRVGRVQQIYLDKDSLKAVVELSLNESTPFPNDTTASIHTAGLVGEQYISLSPGGASVDFVEGDRIKLTQSALVIEELIGKFLTSMGSNNKSSESQNPQ